jgi:hypothetical protein
MTTSRRIVTVAIAMLGLSPTAGAEPRTRSFAWFGELVAIDSPANTLTLRAQIRDNVAGDLQHFKPGDRLVLIWEVMWDVQGTSGADSPVVLAVAPPDQVRFLDDGYVTPAEFVGGDRAGKTVTFKVKTTEALTRASASLATGQWIKVTAPMTQPGPDALLAAIAPAEKPTIKPRGRPPAPAEVSRSPAAAPPQVKANGGISGSWEIRYKTQLATSTYLACELAQDGPAIGGMCKSPGLADTPLAGRANDRDIELQTGGLTYKGTLDAGGAKINGTVEYQRIDLRFEAIKR